MKTKRKEKEKKKQNKTKETNRKRFRPESNSGPSTLEGSNNNISTKFFACSAWPCGKVYARCVEGPEFDSGLKN